MTIGLDLRNPGDVRNRLSNSWKGQLPGDKGDFCHFDTMEHGIRAVAILLINGQQRGCPPRRTIRQIAGHYAPPTENNTAEYIKILSDHTGWDADEEIEMTERENLLAMVGAIIQAEQGIHANEVSLAQIDAGVDMALVDMKLA